MKEMENYLNYTYQCLNCGSFLMVWNCNCLNCNHDNIRYLLNLGFNYPILDYQGQNYYPKTP